MADQTIEAWLEQQLGITVDGSSTVNETNVRQHTKDGARSIVKMLMQQGAINELKYFLKKVAGATSNDVNTAQGGDHNIFDGAPMMVLRKHNSMGGSPYFACREVEQTLEPYVTMSTSAELATKEHPVWLRVGKNALRVYPAPTSDDTADIYAFEMFDGLDEDDEPISGTSAWSNFMKQYSTPLRYYVAEQACYVLMAAEAKTLGTISWSSPTAPTAPVFVDALYNLSAMPTAPSYNPPVTAPDYTRLNTFLDDEDPEMSAVAAQKVQMQLTEYAQDIQDSASKFAEEAKIYDNTLQHIIKDADGLSSTDIANAQNLVAKYAQEVQEFLAEVQEQSLEAQSMTASASGALQSYATLAASYNEKFTTYMMVSFPKPQQGGQNAR
tara:strand:+ start:85 stop:1233 length:1149 start_codon:yes stop_codon:yes gene_type:complete